MPAFQDSNTTDPHDLGDECDPTIAFTWMVSGSLNCSLADCSMPRRSAPFMPDLWQHRELPRQFARRILESALRRSPRELVRSLLNSLLMLGLCIFVSVRIIGRRLGVSPGEPHADCAWGIVLGLGLSWMLASVNGFVLHLARSAGDPGHHPFRRIKPAFADVFQPS
jgi:hypothetical protein